MADELTDFAADLGLSADAAETAEITIAHLFQHISGRQRDSRVRGWAKLTKSDRIKQALENHGIRVVALNRDGDFQLDLGYLLQISPWLKNRYILWRADQKAGGRRLESAFTVGGKNFEDRLARLISGTVPMLRVI